MKRTAKAQKGIMQGMQLWVNFLGTTLVFVTCSYTIHHF
jgi:hypothetical protein